ncbi:MAG TPA: FG-GAP-like repeat-containing protein [Vicinamibacterales bacterium]|nr:FG-GAP-like repeat-containing protein [Vicinamibacterales bacterium]
MVVNWKASVVLAVVIAGAGTRLHAQEIHLPVGADPIWVGPAGAGAGYWLDQGDIGDGDDRKDLIVGAPSAAGRGQVYVIYGGPTFAGRPDLVSRAHVVLSGLVEGGRFGAATATGFILHSEGTLGVQRDLVVGAPGSATSSAGAVYVFAGPLVRGSRDVASAVLTIDGQPGDRLGTSLVTADLNGDGYREVIAGAPGQNRVYVFDLRNKPLNGARVSASAADMTITADADVLGAGVGEVLAAADLTGDAALDVAIAAPRADAGAGRVSVVYGHVRSENWAFPQAVTLSSASAVEFRGVAPGDGAGTSLTVADFISDDTAGQIRDLIIGAPGADGPGGSRPDGGAAYVIWGGSMETRCDPAVATRCVRSLSAPDVIVHGAVAGARTGGSLTGGDINRDTPNDLVLRARGSSGDELQIVYGRRLRSTIGPLVDLAQPGKIDRRIISPTAISSSLVYEVTGEGARDVVVGSPSAETSRGTVAFAISPRIHVAPGTLSLGTMRGTSRTATIAVQNPSVVHLLVGISSDVPWLTVGSSSAQSSAAGAATISATVNAASLAPGNYAGTLQVASTTRDLDMTVLVRVNLTVMAPPTLSASVAGPAAAGQPVTWRVAADTSGGAVEYLFRRYHALTGWVTVRDYAADNSFTWTPADADAGHYMMDVWVRRVGSSAPFEGFASTGYFAVGGALPLVVSSHDADFDGDRRADLSVFRPTNGSWYVLLSSAQYAAAMSRSWGMTADIPVPGDYDGDGRTDFAVYRPENSAWYVLLSGSGYTTTLARGWGMSTDVPVPADYDGDGRTDIAVFRPDTSTWYVLRSASNYTTAMARGWGMTGDIPTPGDYDGDGRVDFAVFRPKTSTWYVLESITGYTTVRTRAWGMEGDRPVAADYDGDRRVDFAVYRPSTAMWYALESSTGYTTVFARAWGIDTDVPVPADYSGSGRAEVAVFRPETSTWFVLNQFARGWGMPGDIPLVMK